MTFSRGIMAARLAVPLAALSLGMSAPALAFDYKEAAKPYAGQKITILDEVTPLQQALAKLIPKFEELTGIDVDYQLLNHFQVIDVGQSDMLAGAGQFDAVMLHSTQVGLLLDADTIRSLDDYLNNPKLANPDINLGDLIQPAQDSLAQFRGQTLGFLNWNYNQIYMARRDLLEHPDEKAAFKARFGYDLGPAQTMQQLRDIAEFFTRTAGQTLAGKTLGEPFYGLLLEGSKQGVTWNGVWRNFVMNWGGDIYDADGNPTFDTPSNIEAVQFWADLWKYGPPGQAEINLIDLPTIMGSGLAAQTLAYSDFILGVDLPGKSPHEGNFIYAGIPRGPGSPSGGAFALTEPSMLVIPRSSKRPEPTFLFLQWLVEQDTQEALAQELGAWVPIRESTWDLPVLTNSRFSNLYEAMRQSVAVSVARPRVPHAFEIFDVMQEAVQRIALGQISASDGMKKAQAKIEDICKGSCAVQ